MGTISKGILGGFSGKVGTVIGGNWKGIDYMRSKSLKGNSKPSLAQLMQQLKFSLCIRLMQSLSGLLDVGFKNYAVRKSGINSAMSYTLKNAVAGDYPDYHIVFSELLVSRGDLPNALSPVATAGAGSQLTFAWADNSGVGIARATDKAILAAYCPALNLCIYTTGSASRSALTDHLDLATFKGQVVETYIGFISEDGRDVANSIYTGQATVL